MRQASVSCFYFTTNVSSNQTFSYSLLNTFLCVSTMYEMIEKAKGNLSRGSAFMGLAGEMTCRWTNHTNKETATCAESNQKGGDWKRRKRRMGLKAWRPEAPSVCGETKQLPGLRWELKPPASTQLNYWGWERRPAPSRKILPGKTSL